MKGGARRARRAAESPADSASDHTLRPTTPIERALNAVAPRATPADAIRLATRDFVEGNRVDLNHVAARLGVHRTTLQRWVGRREDLIGELVSRLIEVALRDATSKAAGEGAERIASIVRCWLDLDHTCIRQFLQREADFALRVMTTKESAVQRRVCDVFRSLLEEEAARGRIHTALPLDDLAYLIVRICESFYYTDMITGAPPAPHKAAAAIQALLDPRSNAGRAPAINRRRPSSS